MAVDKSLEEEDTMGDGYILSIDQGTAGPTALVLDHDGQVRGRACSGVYPALPQAWLGGEVVLWCLIYLSEKTGLAQTPLNCAFYATFIQPSGTMQMPEQLL
jgi:hypothetical protein